MTSEFADPYVLRCSSCSLLFDERIVVMWSKVEGWEKKRDAGGTNHVALRTPLDEFMCPTCMDKLRNGLAAGQLVLG